MTLNLIASFCYVVVTALCGHAALQVRGLGDYPGRQKAISSWALCGTLFLILSVMRALNLEEVLRDLLRESLLLAGDYRERRDLQAPLAAAAVVVTLVFAGLAFRAGGDRRRRSTIAVRAARLASVGMIGLLGLRLISLHAVDRLLYRGPHLNWLFDIGATLCVGGAAWIYPQLVQAEKSTSRSVRRKP